MSDIVERLKDISQNDDHSRGCQGRQYECTCGYDARTQATADDAAAAIERLCAERDAIRKATIEECIAKAKDYALDAQPDSAYSLVCNDLAEAFERFLSSTEQNNAGERREKQIVAMAKELENCPWFKPEDMLVKSGVWATRLWEAAKAAGGPL